MEFKACKKMRMTVDISLALIDVGLEMKQELISKKKKTVCHMIFVAPRI